MKKIIFVFLVLLMAFQLTACSSEASKALREANKAFENENWTDAQVAANQVILNYPGTKEAEKAAKLVEEAGKKLDYEEAEDLVTQAEKAYSENQWKVVINSFSKIEKLAPESDLVDRAAKWNDDAKANWIRELSSNMQNAYTSGDWQAAQSYAADLIQYFPDTDEAQSAKSIQSEAKAKIEEANIAAKREQARSKLRISRCWVNGPDSAGGYELYINYENKSDKVIKYFRFGVTFYNAVGDPISTWRINKIEYCEDTGPIAQGEGIRGNSEYWGKFYDSPIDHPEIVDVEVEYMDGTTWELSDEEISYVQY